jgi:transcription elongation factor GreB
VLDRAQAARDRREVAETSAYITPQGFRKLQEELDQLWRVERRKVTEAVARAAALGDRSENADYIYGKRRLREIDRRIRFLSKRIDDLVVVERAPEQEAEQKAKVYFGAWVTLENEAGDEQLYRVVGPDEFDPARGWISMDSPLGRALLGRRVDDEVTVQRPKGVATFTVIAIRYGEQRS